MIEVPAEVIEVSHVIDDDRDEATPARRLVLVIEDEPDFAQVLLDIGLPDRSGLAVLQELKAHPKTRHISVHVVSASDRSEAALHLGAIGYAVKPTTREQLTSIFTRLEEKSSQKIKRVLLVEDDARQRQSIVELISDTDVEITPVEYPGRTGPAQAHDFRLHDH